MSRRLPPVKLGILIFGVLIAALLTGPAVVPAHAKSAGGSAGGNVTLTLTCTGSSCSGSWFWRQGGITGTLLGSGSIAGVADTTTIETTTQSHAADTLNFGIHAGTASGCGRGAIEYITLGSAVNFTVTAPSSTGSYGAIKCSGGGSTFNIKS
jgi:hypothetical protein